MTERIVPISYIRLVAMLMIVSCHILQYFGSALAWWLNVGVQIFFVVSGFLYGNKAIKTMNFYLSRITSVLVPFWIYLFIVSFLYLPFNAEYRSFEFVINALIGVKTYRGLEHLWFIPHILFCYLITPLLARIKKYVATSFEKTICFLIVTSIVLEVAFRCLGFYFNPSKVLCYVWGYFGGFLYSSHSFKDKQSKMFLCLLAFGGVVLNIIRAVLNSFPVWLSEISHSALGISIFILLFYMFKNASYTAITKIGDRYSYAVYLTHHLYILSSFSVLSLNLPLVFRLAILFVMIALSSFALETISSWRKREKIFPGK